MLILEDQPKSSISEKYRVLRTNIQYSSIDKEIKRILVTSSEPGEGKSVTSGNLALAYAQDGKKVLLIDCDLRKPSVHKTFRVSNTLGISDVILNVDKLKDAIIERNENFHIITAGELPPNPSEILGSLAMRNLLDKLNEYYDVIVIDSPPVHAVTDAQILAQKVDGVLLVVKANTTKKDSVIESKNLLDKVGANILGIVLNGAENTAGKYYYYYGEK